MALYDAFISYSHALDKPAAAALQSVIQKLGKPWYRRRALRLRWDDSAPLLHRLINNSRRLFVNGASHRPPK